jgi:hypothetical protein
VSVAAKADRRRTEVAVGIFPDEFTQKATLLAFPDSFWIARDLSAINRALGEV